MGLQKRKLKILCNSEGLLLEALYLSCWCALLLYAFFGLRLLYIAWRSDSTASQEIEEVQEKLEAGQGKSTFFRRIFSRFCTSIFLESKMSRYDDRYDDRYDRYADRYDRYDRYGGNTKLYVGHISKHTRTQDVELLFGKYGSVRYVDLKYDYGFVEFSDPRDADDARYELDGREIDGSRIIVEFAKGTPRGPGGSRDYTGRGPPPGSGRCFNCGIEGHWARDCNAGDWKNKCYRCGEKGHIERECKNSPRNFKRGRSYSRSPSPHRERSRSRSYSRGRKSYSRSPSPRRNGLPSPRRNGLGAGREEMPSPGRDDRAVGREERRPRSSSYSPRRSASPSGQDGIPVANGKSHPPREQAEGNGSYHSPRGNSQSPARNSHQRP